MRQGSRRGIRTRQMTQIANERIDILFKLAEKEALKGKMSRADRYVELARKIGMRYNVRIPKQYKHHFCKYCYTYLLPGVNCRIRTRGKKIVIFCKKCEKYTRLPFIREVKEKRRRKKNTSL